MISIVQNGDPVLRVSAKPVPLADIPTPKIKRVLSDMAKALAACDDGVAIAAPQIGVSLRIFLIAGKILNTQNKTTTRDLVFINPVIIKTSSKKVTMDEGCLSVRWVYGQMKRAEKATVEAYDATGKKFVKSGSGLIAQIFQHEIDHLDGKLFIDRATDLKEIKPNDL